MKQTVIKPWGYEIIFAHTDKYAGKILHINRGHQLSLQHHEVKDETLFVLRGKGTTLCGSVTHAFNTGDILRVSPKTLHRIKAETDMDIIEVSTPELDDVVRHEDDYGR